MRLNYYLFLILGLCSLTCHGLNILAILPLSMKSHYAIGNSIVKTLLKAGHSVTSISMFSSDKPVKNHRTIHIPPTMNVSSLNDLNPLDYNNIPIWLFLTVIPKMSVEITETIMTSKEVNDFMKTDEKFDVCILELFATEALLGIVEKFNCVLIEYTTYDAIQWNDKVTGNESPASYVPHTFLDYTDKMTFTQRFWSQIHIFYDNFLYKFIHLPNQRRMYKKYFPNAKRSFDEMYKNTSIIFISSHVSYSFPRPHQPNQIEIGGIHLQPAKKLPDDLQHLMDSATDGVVFFSMGSHIDGTDWAVEKREMFIKIFGKLKQKVIWKYSNETLPNNPGNIKIASWLPQRDILAHKNVKLFITHGGLLGTTEAIIEGIPQLNIPVFGDQKMNAAKAVTRGYGLQVHYSDVSEETISNALTELLNNPKYAEEAKTVSETFNDRPLTPQESVVYWTEFAAKHRGAKHLQAHSINLNFIEFYMIDVYFVIFFMIFIILYIKLRILKFLIRKLFQKNNDKKKTQ